MQVPALQNPAAATARAATSLPGLRTAESTAGVPVQAVASTPAVRHAAQQPAEPFQLRTGSAAAPNAFREPGLQQRVGALQQGLAYVDQLGQALQDLKQGLSRSLARPQARPDAGLPQQLATLQQAWQARTGQGAGQIDAQLEPVAEGGSARQVFRLRGLDLDSLVQGGNETLRLAVPGQLRPLSIPLDGQGLQQQLNRLRDGLAPAGIRVETGDGQLQLSSEESRWPALRDGLSLRGDGRRFPSGQMVRAPLEPAADALAPSSWRLEGTEAQRQSLGRVLDAQRRLGQARETLAARLDATAAADNTVPAAEDGPRAAAMQQLATEFADSGSGAPLDYARLSELVPALTGLHRQQVQQLLHAA